MRAAGSRLSVANSAGQAALHLAGHAAEVTVLVRGDSMDRAMSRYLVDRIEQHDRITVRTRTEVVGRDGRDRLESVAIEGPEGGQILPTDALFVLIGAAPLTAGVEDWLRCDDRGYFVTGPDLVTGSDRSWWPLERDPLFLESSQPGVFVAGDVRHGSIKRVASAVGEGAMAASLIHSYLAARDEDTRPV
jgi:thioredoxin reductase (NADPH)